MAKHYTRKYEALASLKPKDALKLLSGRNRSGMRMALKAAKTAPEQRYSIGACIMNGSIVLGTTWNIMYKTHPQGSGIFSTAHAETRLVAMLNDIQGSTLYIVRLSTQGFLRLARPCHDCMNMLITSKVSAVIYSVDYGWTIEKI